MPIKQSAQVTIANGESLSTVISTGSHVLCAITMPAAWTAAALSFQVSDDGGATWYELVDSGGVAMYVPSIAVIAGGRISLDPSAFASVDYLKVRSGLLALPVNQDAARTLTITSRHYYAEK